MNWDLRYFILFIHILLAIIWFGGVLFVGWGVFPASKKLKPIIQREFLLHLMSWIHFPLTFAGLGVITTGIILGTFRGPLKSWESIVSTSYGHLFATALVVAVFTLLWGMFVGYKHTMTILCSTDIWQKAEDGDNKPFKKAFLGIAALESVEIAGFIIILICMVLI